MKQRLKKEERSKVITFGGFGGAQADVTLPLELCLEWIGGSGSNNPHPKKVERREKKRREEGKEGC